jgi:hypothetical protein
MQDVRRRTAVLAVVALTLGAATAPAHAGTASGRPAQFMAAGGERNDLTVDQGTGGAVQFRDAGAPIAAGLWCVPIPLGEAMCDPDGDPRDTDGGGVNVDLGDVDDRALVRWIPGTGIRPGALRIAGGAGNDRLENAASGVVRFDGGDGDDTLVTGPTAGAVLLGGAGADLMTSSAGYGVAASYADHDRAGVRVTLDGVPNDGAAGEGDDVRTIWVIGSPGPDTLTGDERANTLIGSGGADVLDGAGGDDSLDATLADAQDPSGPDAADTVVCGPGNDVVGADDNDSAGVDCERIRVGAPVGPELVLAMGAGRASRTGSVRLTYRVAFPQPGNAVRSRSTFTLVDRQGRVASSTVGFVLGDSANVARVRVRLNRGTRRRLVRSRAGALRLIAQRVSRDADPDSPTARRETFNVVVTIRRAR